MAMDGHRSGVSRQTAWSEHHRMTMDAASQFITLREG